MVVKTIKRDKVMAFIWCNKMLEMQFIVNAVAVAVF